MSGRLSRAIASWLTAIAVICALSPAKAELSAQDFVAAIYKNYQGKDAPGLAIDSKEAKGAITPALMKLIDADANAAAKRNEPPELNGDPFVDAQEWDIPAFKIDVTESGKTKARATVSFRNLDRDVVVTLDLIKSGSSWRIDDFSGPSGSLRIALSKEK